MSAVAAEVSAAVPPLVAVVGATGTGKSAFALDLVEELRCECCRHALQCTGEAVV